VDGRDNHETVPHDEDRRSQDDEVETDQGDNVLERATGNVPTDQDDVRVDDTRHADPTAVDRERQFFEQVPYDPTGGTARQLLVIAIRRRHLRIDIIIDKDDS
jgi:hypothetical protein